MPKTACGDRQARVGVRVINSRKAKNEVRANRITEPRPPVAKANPKIATIIHHARVRALRFWTVDLCLSSVTRMTIPSQSMTTNTNKTSTPPTSQNVCLSSSRFIILRSDLDRILCAFKKPIFPRRIQVLLERRNSTPPSERHWQKFALGENAIQIFK